MELTTLSSVALLGFTLFMMSKIQNLNGTHNLNSETADFPEVVYDVKDTKFEWNSQQSTLMMPKHLRCL